MTTAAGNGTEGTAPGGDHGAVKARTRAPTTRRTAYALLAAAALLTVAGLVYAYRIGIHFGLVVAQQIHAATEVKGEATLSHLWFEEILSGDRHEDMSDVWGHLDNAEWHARAMLEGGECKHGTFFPLDDPAQRQAIENVVRGLAKLRKATTRRWELRGSAAAGTAIDQEYDRAFEAFMAEVSGVEMQLFEHTAGDVSIFRWTFSALVFITVTLYAAGGVTLWRSAEQRRLAERSLAASEKNVQITLDSIGDAVIATDAEGRITRVNPVAERLTGWARDEAMGRQLSEVFNIVNELTRQEVENPVARVLREGRVVGLANHTLLIAKDGTEHPIADSGAPIAEEDGGEIRGVVLVFRDQTEERRAQRRIEHLNQILRAIRNVNQLITTEKDRDALLRGACECLTEARGFGSAWIAVLDETGRAAASAESGIGEGFRRLTERLEAGTLPACAKRALVHADVVTTEAAASACADCPLEESHTCGPAITSRLESAGKIYGVMSISVPAQSLSDSEELTLARELANDIALALHAISLEEGRKRAEEALKESKAFLEATGRMAKIGGWQLEVETFDFEWTDQMYRLFELPIGRKLPVDQHLEFFPPDDRAKLTEAMQRASEHGEPYDMVLRFVTARGNQLWVRAIGKPIIEHGKTARLAGTFQDVTEHRKLEEQLLHTQKMEAIGTLAGGIAHDFNNLLQGILGYANLLKLQSKEGDKVFKAADVIERAGTRAAELTTQLLGFARKGKLREAPVDLHRIIGDVVAILSRTISKRIVMTQRLTAEPPIAKGDPGQLQQVIMNLAVNARDAMPESGELTFETATVNLSEEDCASRVGASPGPYLVVSVRDTGCGIPEDVRHRIFEPFFTTKEQGEGTGMGLPMVYGIAKNHGGWVEVESDVGKGTAFSVYLPLVEEVVAGAITHPAEAVAGSGTILVVDDEETVREIIKEMLTSLGYEVVLARDGREAIEYYREHVDEIDLVVIDLTMPVMDGGACFRAMKGTNPAVKGVISTGHALEGTAQDLLDEGILGFVQKPYTLVELSHAVAKALGQKA